MSDTGDHYESYYSEKLWNLLPEVYRAEDSPVFGEKGPLRELVERVGTEAAHLRRSIDRLWDDAYVETCDDWVIPYIASLLQTNLVPGLDARGQRLDVAKTIYYRRRKGTLPLLEELSADITGWEVKVVEFFRRLARSRHGLDPKFGLPDNGFVPDSLQQSQGIVGRWSGTPMGGFADLGSGYGASRTGSAFDEFHYTADVRNGRGRQGWYNIPRLGIFVWRLKSYRLQHTTPVAVQGCPDWYTFDPTGRDTPLFCVPAGRAGVAGNAEEWQLPSAIDERLWKAYERNLYATSQMNRASVAVFRQGGISGPELVPPDDQTLQIWPQRGRFLATVGPFLGTYALGFSSEIGAGGYDRRAQRSTNLPLPVLLAKGGGPLPTVSEGTLTIGDSLTYSPPTASNIDQVAIVAANEHRAVVRTPPFVIGRRSEWTFQSAAGKRARLTLDGLLVSGPNIVLKGSFDTVIIRSTTLDPGSLDRSSGAFANSADGRPLVASGVVVEGEVGTILIDRSICGPIRTRGSGVLGTLRVTDSILQGLGETSRSKFSAADILDPISLALSMKSASSKLSKRLVGAMPQKGKKLLQAYGGLPPVPQALLAAMRGALNKLVGGPSIFDPVSFSNAQLSPETITLLSSKPKGVSLQRLNRLLFEEFFPYALGTAAIAVRTGDVCLERTTVLGRVHCHRFHVSDSILDDVATTEDLQHGCVRFSAWSTGSSLPRQYESIRMEPRSAIFTSRVFSHPGYAQLLDSADLSVVSPPGSSILEGAESGSEMGAFHIEQNSIKRRALLAKLEEFMPVGLSPVIVPIT